MIGFDYRKLPLVTNAFEVDDLPLADFRPADVRVLDAEGRFADLRVGEPCHQYDFRPPSGWQGHVAFSEPAQPAPAELLQPQT